MTGGGEPNEEEIKLVTIKWNNYKNTHCRVVFATPEKTWVLERDAPWEYDALYSINKNQEVILDVERGRKLWSKLTAHKFYVKNLNKGDNDNDKT